MAVKKGYAFTKQRVGGILGVGGTNRLLMTKVDSARRRGKQCKAFPKGELQQVAQSLRIPLRKRELVYRTKDELCEAISRKVGDNSTPIRNQLKKKKAPAKKKEIPANMIIKNAKIMIRAHVPNANVAFKMIENQIKANKLTRKQDIANVWMKQAILLRKMNAAAPVKKRRANKNLKALPVKRRKVSLPEPEPEPMNVNYMSNSSMENVPILKRKAPNTNRNNRSPVKRRNTRVNVNTALANLKKDLKELRVPNSITNDAAIRAQLQNGVASDSIFNQYVNVLRISTPHKTLNVDANTGGRDLRKAYFKRARTLHPDKGGKKRVFQAMGRMYNEMRLINKYATMSQNQYDRERNNAFSSDNKLYAYVAAQRRREKNAVSPNMVRLIAMLARKQQEKKKNLLPAPAPTPKAVPKKKGPLALPPASKKIQKKKKEPTRRRTYGLRSRNRTTRSGKIRSRS
jgi:hypothetical protein